MSLSHYEQLLDDQTTENNNNNSPQPQQQTSITFAQNDDTLEYQQYHLGNGYHQPTQYYEHQQPVIVTPSQIKLNELLYKQQYQTQVKSFGPQQSNCCVRYWLSTALLVLLCCSLMVMGMGIVMVRTTFNNNPYPGRWHKNICHVPEVDESPHWETEFFAPCKHGFRCNVCKIQDVTLVAHINPEDEKEQVITVPILIAHDITEDQCLKITTDRRFNCVWHLTPKPDQQQITNASNTFTILPNEAKDQDGYTITIIARDEYDLDHKSLLSHVQTAITVFAIGVFLFMIYATLALYKCCLTTLQRHFTCLRFLSPKYCCSWLLYKCCFKRVIEEERNRQQLLLGQQQHLYHHQQQPPLPHQQQYPQQHYQRDNNDNIQPNNSKNSPVPLKTDQNHLWVPNADVIMDEGNESHFQFDLDSTDEEEALDRNPNLNLQK